MSINIDHRVIIVRIIFEFLLKYFDFVIPVFYIHFFQDLRFKRYHKIPISLRNKIIYFC